jgi:CheY-like chemotaxis protein
MENFNTPVIALTANAISGMKEEYLSLGFDDYLSKPIEKKELERVITTYIHKSNVQEMNSSSSSNASSIIDFDFQLPMLAGAHKEEVAEQKEEALETPKEENTLCKRLLIVDDNDVNLKVATSAFKNYSSEIVTVKSGSEAIEKVITEERFDLILLDDMMPEMDGPTTLDNLRDIDGFDVPTVLTTASSEDEVQDKLEEHHFDGYLSKPFKKEEIESLLNALLNK